ncbi:helix-turn-helix domain-containing protein [Marivirga sp.]|uniref:helix-turn-helix domain-containing protein n=1 Tax=Marivirga sp. TaxID=2018662 RepID=UPI003DA70FAC
MKSLGEYIRELREEAEWPQRKLAYELDVDVAVLSRIENENKFPKKRIPKIIKRVSELFNITEEELKKIYLSDEIAELLLYENKYDEILKVSEAKVHYGRQKNSIQSNLNFSDESN